MRVIGSLLDNESITLALKKSLLIEYGRHYN